MKADYAVFIGRFQPLHLGHQHVIDTALKKAKRVIVLIGSADSSPSLRNPWSYDSRTFMFRAVYRDALKSGRLILAPIFDHAYNDEAWVAQVQSTVNDIVLENAPGNSARVTLHGTRDFKIVLAGYAKDHTSYYLKLFPEWGQLNIDPPRVLDATNIRKAFFATLPDWDVIGEACDGRIQQWLREEIQLPEFQWMVDERNFIDSYRASWANAPYPPVFATVDAIVVQSGNVLLIRRGDHPGKGLLAIPGGYVNQYERLRDAVVRELKEETAIADEKGSIPPAMLSSFIEGEPRVFDAPHRSERGRVITHAFLFRLPERRKLYSVLGQDDAAHASWYRLGDIKPHEMFEDHYAILQQMIGI